MFFSLYRFILCLKVKLFCFVCNFNVPGYMLIVWCTSYPATPVRNTVQSNRWFVYNSICCYIWQQIETKMKFLEFREELSAFTVFSYPDILKVNPSFDRRRLVEWQAKKYILKIRNGYYCFPQKEINESYLMYISNRIYKPSYISMETALSYYNLIPEAVYLFTGISTRKTMLFESALGNYQYREWYC